MRTVPLAVLLVAFFILGSMVSIPRAHALPPPITWNGAAGDGKWETAGNWVGGVPPGPGDVVVILPGAFAVTISTTQSIFALTVGLGDTVTCESTCTLALTSLSGLNNLGTFTNFGTVTSNGLGNAGTFTNYGTVTLTTLLVNVGTFTNFGTVTIGVTFVNGGTFTNRCHGTVNITPTSGTGTFTTDPTCPAVGGVVTTVNAFSILAPWIGVLGLVGCIGTVVVFAKKHCK
jgi:hypothetical protein